MGFENRDKIPQRRDGASWEFGVESSEMGETTSWEFEDGRWESEDRRHEHVAYAGF